MIRTSNTSESHGVANATQRNPNYANVIRFEALTSFSRALAAFYHLFTQQYSFPIWQHVGFSHGWRASQCTGDQSRLWTILLDIPILTIANECIYANATSASHTHTSEHVYKNYGIISFNYSMHCIELNNLTSSIWKHLNCEVERKSFRFVSPRLFLSFFSRVVFSESFGRTVCCQCAPVRGLIERTNRKWRPSIKLFVRDVYLRFRL